MDNHSRSDFAWSAPYWLRRTGVVSWLFLAVITVFNLILDFMLCWAQPPGRMSV